jgi:RNA polymerase sigma-70 factor (ECF subfamily)
MEHPPQPAAAPADVTRPQAADPVGGPVRVPAGGPAEPRLTASLRAFVAAHAPPQDVDDIVQDVFLRWTLRAGSLTSEELEPWLIATARHRAIDALRARGAAPANAEALTYVAHEPPPRGALSQLVCCLEAMLAALDPEQRALLRRVDAEGASQASIAAELGLSPSGLRARVQRARARLRAEFDACCEFERDARGGVIDWRVRPTDDGSRAPCGGADGPSSTDCGCR